MTATFAEPLCVLDMRQGVLEPTPTYRRREWRWIPFAPGSVFDGMLAIFLQHAERGNRRKPVKQESDYYAVVEVNDPRLPAGVRSFILCNAKPPEEDEPGPNGEPRADQYECTVGGFREFCSCAMGGFDQRRVEETGCKHRSAMRALCEEGVL